MPVSDKGRGTANAKYPCSFLFPCMWVYNKLRDCREKGNDGKYTSLEKDMFSHGGVHRISRDLLSDVLLPS